jgi:hypothetical protein
MSWLAEGDREEGVAPARGQHQDGGATARGQHQGEAKR